MGWHSEWVEAHQKTIIEAREKRKAITAARNAELRAPEVARIALKRKLSAEKKEALAVERAERKAYWEERRAGAADRRRQREKAKLKSGWTLPELNQFKASIKFVVGVSKAVWVEHERLLEKERMAFEKAEHKRGWDEHLQWCVENKDAIKKAARVRGNAAKVERIKKKNIEKYGRVLTEKELRQARSVAMKQVWKDRGADAEATRRERNRWRNYKKAIRGYGYSALGGRLNNDTIPNMLKHQENKCVICECDISEKHEVDHIYPVSKGGCHEPWNLQLLCPPCNVRKGDNI